jgi:hypothetical protein
MAGRRFFEAHHCSIIFQVPDFFIATFVGLIADSLKRNQDILPFFRDCEFLAGILCPKLPAECQHFADRLLFPKIRDQSIHGSFSGLNELQRISQLLEIFPNLYFDVLLLQMAEIEISTHPTDPFPTLLDLVHGHLALMKQRRPLVNMICYKVIQSVNSVVVDSRESEFQAVAILRVSQRILELTKFILNDFFGFEVQMLQISFLLGFSNLQVFSRYKASYSFHDFQKLDFMAGLIHICRQFDLFDVLKNANGLWAVNMDSVNMGVALDSFRFGLLNEGRRLLSQIKPNRENDLKLIPRIIDLLRHPSPVQIAFMPWKAGSPSYACYCSDALSGLSGKVLRVSLYYQFVPVALSSRESGTLNQVIIQELIDFFDDPEQKVLFSVILEDFDRAFLFWKQLPMNKQIVSNAMKLLLIPALSFGCWEKLWSIVLKHAAAFRPVVDRFLEYCQAHRLKRTLAFVQFALESYKDAILSVLTFLRDDNTWQEKLSDGALLVEAAQRESNHRDGKSGKFLIPSEELRHLAHAAGVQMRFAQLAIDRQIPFHPLFDVTLYAHYVEEMASIAFFLYRFNLGIEISELKEGAMGAAMDLLLDKLTVQGLAGYYKIMKSRMDQQRLRFLATELLRALKNRAANKADVPTFVMGVVTDRPLLLHILAELDYLDHALRVGESLGNRQHFLDILQLAEIRKNKRVAARCRQLLR